MIQRKMVLKYIFAFIFFFRHLVAFHLIMNALTKNPIVCYFELPVPSFIISLCVALFVDVFLLLVAFVFVNLIWKIKFKYNFRLPDTDKKLFRLNYCNINS